jgi:hypothetical protein
MSENIMSNESIAYSQKQDYQAKSSPLLAAQLMKVIQYNSTVRMGSHMPWVNGFNMSNSPAKNRKEIEQNDTPIPSIE